jgi:phenylalanine ammonia-lyase
VRQLHYGILSPENSRPQNGTAAQDRNGINHIGDDGVGQLGFFQRARLNEDQANNSSMPESWIRASMLIRSNSLATGHSGLTLPLLQNIVQLLRLDILPLTPLRGSISASGDLSPLSYLAGLVQGNPNIRAWVGTHGHDRHHVPADEALRAVNIQPSDLGPKEGLAITNGTSVSAGVAALALHDAHHMAILSQVLTAMGVEALTGTAESFEQLIADVRPHPGQIESCRNIRNFLRGSWLVRSYASERDEHVMRQDRYALRTSTQWIGPQLEDLCLAQSQIVIDCNSTTDNPIIDADGERVLHGGNFQAQAITSAVEKIRQSAQRIGRMLFAQSTELVNPALNNGLPPNLVADEPGRSFLMKGVDIATAAYMSELGFLANPVGSHVQNAELGNQSINSLALISARYTHMALDVLSQLSAAYLYSLCQALDLRAMQALYLETFQPVFRELLREQLGCFVRSSMSKDDTEVATTEFTAVLWNGFVRELNATTSMSANNRFTTIFSRLVGVALASDALKEHDTLLKALTGWVQQVSSEALRVFLDNREAYTHSADASPYLGRASRRMYHFVRHDLGVPFLRRETSSGPKAGQFDEVPGYAGTTGSMLTLIYDSMRSGELYVPLMECLRESLTEVEGRRVKDEE